MLTLYHFLFWFGFLQFVLQALQVFGSFFGLFGGQVLEHLLHGGGQLRQGGLDFRREARVETALNGLLHPVAFADDDIAALQVAAHVNVDGLPSS